MNIYLACDIEGSCGYTSHEEGRVGTNLYDQFRRQMTLEVGAACRGAKKAGGETILAHDAHGNSRNIMADLLPRGVELLRMSGGDPYAQLSGAQYGEFDAVMLTGFHSGATSSGSPASHTFRLGYHHALYLNGQVLSEFLFDAYSAASLWLPVPFISGDKAICEVARQTIPGITTVEAVTGFGYGTRSRHPEEVIEEIEAKAEQAFNGNWQQCIAPLPKELEFTMVFQQHQTAAFNSYYPGMKQLDDVTLQYHGKDWYDILQMVHFVLDK